MRNLEVYTHGKIGIGLPLTDPQPVNTAFKFREGSFLRGKPRTSIKPPGHANPSGFFGVRGALAKDTLGAAAADAAVAAPSNPDPLEPEGCDASLLA